MIDLQHFCKRNSETVIKADPILYSRDKILMNAKNEASEAYFKAYDAVHPNTVVDVLWIEAKAGYTKEVVPSMNLNKATRMKGLTSSVKRLLLIRTIDVNSDDDDNSPLHSAAYYGKVEIVRLLIDKGADLNAIEFDGSTPSQWRLLVFFTSH